ncbi:hypothetical protein K470DRAFT_260841 [Piedraia hortae CBS 480.64]|uniref:dolichol kinase n=1 Tax=Piedraia hortae CBS 480.64 TaxID=1314780 RepID=A0A6A7BR96_9PEZI|nr:hypothetical protein K470DRAFT_260841 [Piedraia hortae CBS 480.64]
MNGEELRSLRRTPRPYLHDAKSVRQDGLHTQNNDNCQVRISSISQSSTESGTDADDERPRFAKALPPALFKPRKGLITGETSDDALLTPSQLDDEGRINYFANRLQRTASAEERKAEEEKILRRRLAELARRSSEVGLMVATMLAVLAGSGVQKVARRWLLGLLSHFVIVAVLILAYPVKLSLIDSQRKPTRIWQRFRVPASFDPATVLYPPFLPVLVALSVSPANDAVVLPNLILGLSTLPQRLFPRYSRLGDINSLHWLISIIPLILCDSLLHQQQTLSRETLVSLYALHQALLLPLYYLTTSSLLISELHLLSVALINLLLLAESLQAVILKACLWIGGVTIFVLCRPVLSWNVRLARVPNWKLRRSNKISRQENQLVNAISRLINLQRATKAFRMREDSDADEDKPFLPPYPDTNVPPPRLSRSRRLQWYQRLTPTQSLHRQRLYATYIYTIILLTALLPVRSYIQTTALKGEDLIIWVISYLLPHPGVSLPPRLLISIYWLLTLTLGLSILPLLSHAETDTRRKIFHGIIVLILLPTTFLDPVFCALALTFALVVFLTVEMLRAGQVWPVGKQIGRFIAPFVDGRDLRGPVVVSHFFLLSGCAVPVWFSLAGSWEKRGDASLASDESGPVSNGLPLLAPLGREVAMVAGVVCVGMGDAAASLLGRRYGSHKWPWVGGKSLEGSLGFAGAATLGLCAAKVWLRVGGWRDGNGASGVFTTVGKAMVSASAASFLEAVLTGANDNVLVPIVLWLFVKGLGV